MWNTLAAFILIAAVQANPVAVPQAVTAAISPSAAAPPGCTAAYNGNFGIAVYNLSTSAAANKKREDATQEQDGQVQAQTLGDVSVISDGQVQAGTSTTVLPVAQIGDGQVQAHTTFAVPVTQIADGQPQAPTIASPTVTATAASQISDAQVQAPTNQAATSPTTATELAATEAPDAQIPEDPASPAPANAETVACQQDDSLTLTLENGVLKDAQGRTGYIASNYQFQFDAPPQAGAIYTSGFTTCANGTLALGGSNIFYQCLSGTFYNLYDRPWAAQCLPVTISTVELVSCP